MRDRVARRGTVRRSVSCPADDRRTDSGAGIARMIAEARSAWQMPAIARDDGGDLTHQTSGKLLKNQPFTDLIAAGFVAPL